MPLWKLHRIILIITLVTGIVHSMQKGKPNTFWSKRAGQQELSDKMHKDGSQYFSESTETERISKLLREFRFLPFSTILHKIQQYNHFFKESTFDEVLLPK